MSNFEAAVEMSLNNWVASFPAEFDLPQPTEKYNRGIAKLMDKMRGDRYHKLTRSAARAILIAAIIMAIATVAIAATVGRDFIVQKFHDYSTYSVIDSSGVKDVEDIHIGYIPEGFEMINKETSNNDSFLTFSNKEKWINIYKSKINHEIAFDTEHNDSEIIKNNSFNGVYYKDENFNYSGVTWNDGVFVFTIEGNVSKEELTRIAENIS
jgi:hypothetical protein